MFNPEKYRNRIEENKRRHQISASWQEPDRVPIHISTGGSFYSRLFGYNIRDYYSDPEVCLEVQLKGLEWAYEELQDDRTGFGIHVDFGPIGEGLYFDLPLEYPDDTSPWSLRMMDTPADIEAFEVPDPTESRGLEIALRRIEGFRNLAKRRGIDLPVGGGIGIHPPLSCACALA